MVGGGLRAAGIGFLLLVPLRLATFQKEGLIIKVKDEARWQEQLAQIAADPDPIAKKFVAWVVDWCELAEQLIDYDCGPVEALRKTLRKSEETHKHWPAILLGQALLLIQDHWEPAGDQETFYGAMTTIEQNMFLDVAATWVQVQQQKAQQAGEKNIEDLFAPNGGN